jgi:hypothetical protein
MFSLPKSLIPQLTNIDKEFTESLTESEKTERVHTSDDSEDGSEKDSKIESDAAESEQGDVSDDVPDVDSESNKSYHGKEDLLETMNGEIEEKKGETPEEQTSEKNTLNDTKQPIVIVDDNDSYADEIEVEFGGKKGSEQKQDAQQLADKHTVKDLREMCRKKKLNTQGKKLELAERIIAADDAEDEIICSS